MALHCLNSEGDGALLARLCAQLGTDDALLLLGPAASIARSTHPALAPLLRCAGAVFALDDDLALYGVEPRDERVRNIGYDGFVALAVEHRSQLLWR